MTKYIDIEKLKAEIERLYDGEAPKHAQQCDFDDGYFTGIDAISRFIDSFQQEQPEVDIRSELEKYIFPISVETMKKEPFTQLEKCAHYFYELGLKARKEE